MTTADIRPRREHRVEVDGGVLTVHEWIGVGPVAAPEASAPPGVVLALHGITANGRSFGALAAALPAGTRVLAPDLRGRAASRGVTGPWGLAAHADDVVAIIGALALDRPVLVGHSMGAFVAALTAVRHPELFERVVLIDGGVGFPVPPETDIDALLTAVIGPAMTRLSMTFPDEDAYLAFMTQNPAVAGVFAGGGTPAAVFRDYLHHDLVPAADGRVASSCLLEAIRVDGGQVVTDPETLGAAARLAVPTTMLWAERGMADQVPGLYTAPLLAAAVVAGTVVLQQVPDTNHYSILVAPAAVRRLVGAVSGAA